MARTIYTPCIYGTFGRETTQYTVIHGVYIRIKQTQLIIQDWQEVRGTVMYGVYMWHWPSLDICVVWCGVFNQEVALKCAYAGLARAVYTRCIYSIFGREVTKNAVIYGVYMRFWPTLCTRSSGQVRGYMKSKDSPSTSSQVKTVQPRRRKVSTLTPVREQKPTQIVAPPRWHVALSGQLAAHRP